MSECTLVNRHILCKFVVSLADDYPEEHPDYLTRDMLDGQHVLIKPCVFSGEYCSVTDPKYKPARVPELKDEQERKEEESNVVKPSLSPKMKV